MTRLVAVAALSVSLSLLGLGCVGAAPPEVGVVEEGLSVCPGATTLKGVDTSTYEGTIDWTKVKAAGLAFAITRVGDGLGGDDTFDANWKGIKAVGMVRGAYQYFRAGDDPIKQADILLGKIGTPANGDLPPTLDLETLDGQSAATVVANAKKWLEYVKMKSGRTPMIYTSPGFWPSIGSPDLSEYVLWVAHWGVTCPSMPTGWKTWAVHQTTDSGSVSGIPGAAGAVDLDVFDGDQDALNALASNGASATSPDLGGTTPTPTEDMGEASDAPDLGNGNGNGNGDGSGGNGDDGAMAHHGCSMGAGDVGPGAVLVVLMLVGQLREKRRRHQLRRGAGGV